MIRFESVNRQRLHGALLVLVGVAFFLAPAAVAAAPSITSLSPTSGAVGAVVTIAGSGFGATQGTSTVKFSGTTATVTSWSATTIVAVVPTGATTGSVVVRVGSTNSNGKTFTVVAPPRITSLSPTSGAPGTSVTITGTAFGSSQGSGSVKFNGTTATVTSWSATGIVATVPGSATSGNVVVRASGVDSNGVAFTVVPPPQITSLSRTSGAIGATVVITGAGFGATQGSSTAKFNATTATVTSWTATSLTTTVPTGATTGNIVVRVGGVNSNGVSFTVVAAPSISSLSPTAGAIGTTVTVNGSGFGAAQADGTVTFNGVAGTPSSWTTTRLLVSVPSGASTGNVVVRASGVASNGRSFTVYPPPSITALNPTSGAPGTSVTIDGTNLGATQGTSTIAFNGTAATPTSWSTARIVTTVPAAATTGDVTVRVSGVTSNGVRFTVPTLTSIELSPASATTIPVDGSKRFSALGHYTDGSARDITASVTWSLEDPSTASADATGRIIGTAVGTTNVWAELGDFSAIAPVTVTPGRFRYTGSMSMQREQPSAVTLQNGMTLVIGGHGPDYGALATCELYDPATERFSPTGSLRLHRYGHTVTRLADGRVLVVGGGGSLPWEDTFYVASAELYDPSTGTFRWTGSLNYGRAWHTATLLADGRVLIAGGTGVDFNPALVAEIYDPETETFTPTGSVVAVRSWGTATRLNDGKVLLAGGNDWDGTNLGSAETYDPATGQFTATGSLGVATFSHTATLLADGRVLIAGGTASDSTARAELFDPTTRQFTPTGSLVAARSAATATMLNDGRVLITGGASLGPITSAELYDPTTGTFELAGRLRTGRYFHDTALLPDGSVLVVGGTATARLASAEVYQSSETLPAPYLLRVTPGTATLLVGASREFTAVDQAGRPRTDAVWTVGDPSLAALPTPGSATLVALAAGTTTVTATIEGVSAQAIVTILADAQYPAGSASWAAGPLAAGVPRKQVLKATLGAAGSAGLFAISGDSTQTIIEALTTDGRQLWQSQMDAVSSPAAPDPYGGLLLTLNAGCDHQNPMRLMDVDGKTGQVIWEYVGGSSCTSDPPETAHRRDGAVVVATKGNTSGFPELMILDAWNGQTIQAPAIPASYFTDVTGSGLPATRASAPRWWTQRASPTWPTSSARWGIRRG